MAKKHKSEEHHPEASQGEGNPEPSRYHGDKVQPEVSEQKGGKVHEHTFAEAAAYFADQLTYATGAPYLQQMALADVFEFNLVPGHVFVE